jgi:hypothetical protein
VLGIRHQPPKHPLQIGAVAAISMGLYFASWWLFFSGARS